MGMKKRTKKRSIEKEKKRKAKEQPNGGMKKKWKKQKTIAGEQVIINA